MKVFHSSSAFSRYASRGSVVTLGNFDGLHVGHRELIKTLLLESHQRNIPSVVYTFNPHPVEILSPQSSPQAINTLKQKIELIQSCGVDYLILEKFDKSFAKKSSADFFKNILQVNLQSHFITVGYDFTFGAKREGNTTLLRDLCIQNNIEYHILPPFMDHNTLVSSSIIRKAIREGRLEDCISLLSRPYFLDGVIIKGHQRGHQLGVPTANLKTEQALIPLSGVYITAAKIQNTLYPSITNIGTNPTFGTHPQTIETHLLQENQLLYKCKMRLFFLKRLRSEKHFENPSQLQAQLKKDINKAQEFHNLYPVSSLAQW